MRPISVELCSRRFKLLASLSFASVVSTVAAGAVAQPVNDDASDFDKSGNDALAAKKNQEDEKKAGAKMPGEKDKAPPEAEKVDPELDPREDPNKSYKFIGLRFRNVIVPKFMLNIFADGGTTVNAFTFGPELTSRKDHLEFNFAISYADYSMDSFLFKGKGDGPEAFERVASSMKLLYFTLDILYEIPIDTKGRFAFLFGGGIGLAPVFGNMYRSQVYPKNTNDADPDNAAKWNNCLAKNDPPGPTAAPNKPYCDSDNNHFGDPGQHTGYDEPSWFNGGSKPSIFPWISLPQLSLRVKPIKQINTRVDFGFSITGFFFGMNAGYALPI